MSVARRHGDYAAVNVDELTSLTVSHQVDMFGFGTYQLLLLAGCGSAALTESIEMGVTAPLHSALGNLFEMTENQRAAMAGAAYGGAALGVILSGILCDSIGRKATLVLSSLMIVAASLATAFVQASADISWVVLLRFFSGIASSIGGPASFVLVVECSPAFARANMMFGMIFISSLGYVVDAVGLDAMMPQLGEGPDDDWRGMCFFIAAPAIASLPLLMLLVESPAHMVANQRDVEGCLRCLIYMGYINGKTLADIRLTHVPTPMRASNWKVFEVADIVRQLHVHELLEVGVLMLMDSSRLFFTRGSAYLWKDLFLQAGSLTSVTPGTLNVVASLSPLVGLAIGERLLWMGIHRILLLCTFVGASSMMFLTVPHFREMLCSLIVLVVLTKLVYGPMATCVALIKAETFATEIRAVAFSMISFVAKTSSIIAPVLIEMMKDATADGEDTWSGYALRQYILILVVSICCTGASSFLLPRGIEDGSHLEDYTKATSTATAECLALYHGYGSTSDASSLSYWNIWDGTVRSGTVTVRSPCSQSCSLSDEGRFAVVPEEDSWWSAGNPHALSSSEDAESSHAGCTDVDTSSPK